MALKAGSVANFQGSLTEAMEQAFASEWFAVKNEELPGGGEQERKILFAAVAQGLLNYLEANINGSLKVEVQVTATNSSGIVSEGEDSNVRLVTE
jgi:hypothetical protein